MTKISFSITDASGTASVTIYGGDTNGESSYLLDGGFNKPLTVTTTSGQTIAGGIVVSGRQTDGFKVWSNVRAILSESDYYALEGCALKSDKLRQGGSNMSITFKDEFYKLQEVPPRSRAIASGSVTTMASGNLLYYAAYNVYIPQIQIDKTNLLSNGSLAFAVTFDIVELDKTTP
jgi:hypothetical protein